MTQITFYASHNFNQDARSYQSDRGFGLYGEFLYFVLPDFHKYPKLSEFDENNNEFLILFSRGSMAKAQKL